MKKIVILVLCLVAATTIYCVVIQDRNKTFLNIEPNISAKPIEGNIVQSRNGESAKVMLLNYSFWILNSEFSFVPEELNILNSIAIEYKKLGVEDKHQKLIELYNHYRKDTIATSYLPSYTANFSKKWEEVKELAEKGSYQDAIKASDNDPCALANIAQVLYKKTGNHKMAVELTDVAVEQFKKGAYASGYLTAIVKSYNELDEFEKAYNVVMLSADARFWGTITLPIIKYFANKQDIDVAIQMVIKTDNKNGQAEALLYISQSIKNDGAPLNPKYIKMLEIVLK